MAFLQVILLTVPGVGAGMEPESGFGQILLLDSGDRLRGEPDGSGRVGFRAIVPGLRDH